MFVDQPAIQGQAVENAYISDIYENNSQEEINEAVPFKGQIFEASLKDSQTEREDEDTKLWQQVIEEDHKDEENEVSNNPIYLDTYSYTGEYVGADQNKPVTTSGEEREQIAGIIRNYYPDFSDSDVQNFLKKLSTEGCSYAAICNSLFDHYKDKPEEFQNKFGFSMRNAQGNYNYNLLLVDIYAATDNHNAEYNGVDYIDEEEDTSSEIGVGANYDLQQYRAGLYFKKKGINAVCRPVDVTAENFNEATANGNAVVSLYPLRLRDKETKEVVCSVDNGHAMMVSGVEDNYFKVMSWGMEFLLSPEDVLPNQDSRLKFYLIEYLDNQDSDQTGENNWNQENNNYENNNYENNNYENNNANNWNQENNWNNNENNNYENNWNQNNNWNNYENNGQENSDHNDWQVPVNTEWGKVFQ